MQWRINTATTITDYHPRHHEYIRHVYISIVLKYEYELNNETSAFFISVFYI